MLVYALGLRGLHALLPSLKSNPIQGPFEGIGERKESVVGWLAGWLAGAAHDF